jgi:hypothetical protein
MARIELVTTTPRAFIHGNTPPPDPAGLLGPDDQLVLTIEGDEQRRSRPQQDRVALPAQRAGLAVEGHLSPWTAAERDDDVAVVGQRARREGVVILQRESLDEIVRPAQGSGTQIERPKVTIDSKRKNGAVVSIGKKRERPRMDQSRGGGMSQGGGFHVERSAGDVVGVESKGDSVSGSSVERRGVMRTQRQRSTP